LKEALRGCQWQSEGSSESLALKKKKSFFLWYKKICRPLEKVYWGGRLCRKAIKL
jgi:hypothetical protein